MIFPSTHNWNCTSKEGIEVESCGATWTNFRGINWVNLAPGFAGSLRQATASPDITWEMDLYRIKRVPTPSARQPLHFWFVPLTYYLIYILSYSYSWHPTISDCEFRPLLSPESLRLQRWCCTGTSTVALCRPRRSWASRPGWPWTAPWLAMLPQDSSLLSFLGLVMTGTIFSRNYVIYKYVSLFFLVFCG